MSGHSDAPKHAIASAAPTCADCRDAGQVCPACASFGTSEISKLDNKELNRLATEAVERVSHACKIKAHKCTKTP